MPRVRLARVEAAPVVGDGEADGAGVCPDLDVDPAPLAVPDGASPAARAATAVTAIARPMPMAYSRNRNVSVRPTVAMAEGPSRATNQMSTTANVDSSTSSSTIGTASRNTARCSGILV